MSQGMKTGRLPHPLRYSLWLLDCRFRSEKLMRVALEKKGYDAATVDDTVTKLLDWGYLDDERYKEYLIAKCKRNNVKGRLAVYRQLSADGIDDLDDLEELYTDAEERVLIAKLLDQWERSAALDEKTKDKYYGRLSRRGFMAKNICREMEKRRMISEILT